MSSHPVLLLSYLTLILAIQLFVSCELSVQCVLRIELYRCAPVHLSPYHLSLSLSLSLSLYCSGVGSGAAGSAMAVPLFGRSRPHPPIYCMQ